MYRRAVRFFVRRAFFMLNFVTYGNKSVIYGWK